MKRLIIILGAALLVAPAALSAQEKQLPGVEVSGEISAGGRQVDNDTNSSKYTEYRDLGDDAYLPRLSLNLFDSKKRRFFTFRGKNISLTDQSLAFRAGILGRFHFTVDWNGIPHNFSNKAQTPYAFKAPGWLEAPASVPITFKKLGTAASDAANVLASDQLIANYQAAYLRPTTLSTQSGIGRAAVDVSALEELKLGIAYDRKKKEGLKAAFGPIGDRPPRTLNIQLTEPVDYRTNELTLSAEHVGRWFQAQFSYVLSDFSNQIDTLTWKNIYTNALPDSTFDAWDRAVSVYGRRPLPPDNRYHNVSVAAGVDLPAESRLSATFAYGRLDQNETLLAYSYHSNMLANSTLPRATADAQMETKQAFVDYVINPTERLNLRAWVRHYGLDNNTPEARWQYVTSDTSNLNGTVAYVNKRVSLPFASDRTTGGFDASYRILKSTVNFGYEREKIQRDFREADTDENRVTVSWRLRPARWTTLRARYVYGKRNGDYDPFVTREGYWYTRAEATDFNNPQFTFDNHPDMVRFDAADRRRHQGEFTLILNAGESISFSGHVRYRTDDFDSDVRPTQPLALTGFGEVSATTPGNQLGLLKETRARYSLDAFYMFNDRFSLNAFASRDGGGSRQRGIEFDENHKGDPSTVATADLGGWTRKESQWTADNGDRNWTVGFGSTAEIVPNRVILDASYSVSLGDFDTTYAGYGVTNWNGTPLGGNQPFAFSSPPRINQDLHSVDVRFQFPIVDRVALVLGYNYERFRQDDWQQGTTFPWVEPVGSGFLLRDSSRSHQWGNRLFNLGSYLAPAFNAHLVFAAFSYRF
ncbi:MAG: MtrB/PioB family outer membrane beta-barrel protein [Acidobacteria bacterium]|nr:MtrB/PioB family outer membrane beta-barrel protein [Acidobacteriota bacterium]